MRGVLASVGHAAVSQARRLIQLGALTSALFVAAVRPGTWRRTVRQALARQILSSGVEGAGIICFLAICLGALLVVQYQVWVGRFVQLQVLTSVMVVVTVRELGPLLVSLVLIARSGSAITTELALMHVGREIRVLEGQGISPVHYLVLPRVAGFTISAACLTVFFIAVSFLGVFFCGQWIGTKTGSLSEFLESALGSIAAADVLSLFLKSVIPAMLAATTCCMEGMGAGETLAEAPRASRIAVQRSVVLLFVIGACISIATYL